ncbi:hypothetical protein MTP03_44190 [Tsukamurella sp. PLM1]|nr:hypothetical protein MTP03_44190 [Tsukamurella sp. PLM1]
MPEVTTVTDSTGAPMAYLYDQRRVQVPFDQISPNMVRAIISIEDKRFMEHDGVDYQGTLRAFLKNQSAGEVQQGASTLDQQYIKNYQLLVLAKSDADRRAAVATTPARKLREVRMALTLERTLTERAKQEHGVDDAKAKLIAKEQILARYLNIVPFGNGAFGIEVAAQTYFGKRASQLNIEESAMLAGMVQSSEALNPYTNPQRVTERRNTVLDTLVQNFPDKAAEYAEAKAKPLGVLPRPNTLPGGCISAVANRGYFCDYVLQYLAQAGIPKETVLRGGYTIRTTLDPRVQDSVQAALNGTASPTLSNVAQVMNVIKPGQDSHDIVAMNSSRVYGLDVSKRQTVQPEPFAQVGDGAGSTFKIFTVAAAMEKGMGLDTTVTVPSTVQVKGMGHGGYAGCPSDSYCVKNAGPYPYSMSLTQALATSPNTPFIKLIEQVGVSPVVDMAVRLGLRSYTQPGSSGFGTDSLADMFKKQNLASFTLGPTAVSALELTNVAATLASGGVWCPANPIQSITQPKRNSDGIQTVGADGKPETVPVPFKSEKCEQVIDKGLANTLANALSQDDRGAGRRPPRPRAPAGRCRSPVRPAPRRRSVRRRSSGTPTSTPVPATFTTTATPPAPSAPARCARAVRATCTAATSRRRRGTPRSSRSRRSTAPCRCRPWTRSTRTASAPARSPTSSGSRRRRRSPASRRRASRRRSRTSTTPPRAAPSSPRPRRASHSRGRRSR